MKKIKKAFVSDIDQALDAFNQSHDDSAAQMDEKNKYARIEQLRDEIKLDTNQNKKIFWPDD